MSNAKRRHIELFVTLPRSLRRLHLSATTTRNVTARGHPQNPQLPYSIIAFSSYRQVLAALLAPLQQLLQVLLAQHPDVLQALHNLLSRACQRTRLPAKLRR